MNKKDLTPILLQSLSSLNGHLSSLHSNHENLIEKDFNEQKLLRFKDLEKDSNFKFELRNVVLSKGIPVFSFELAPSSLTENKPLLMTQNEKGTLIMFQKWIDWLKAYDEFHLTPDDELQKRYENEFFDRYEIIEENANKEPFSIEQQLFLNEYLTNSQKQLELLAESKNSEEKVEIDYLIKEAESIKKVLTKESKNKIVKRLSKFWASARKTGIDVMKEVFVEVIAEIGKRLLLGK